MYNMPPQKGRDPNNKSGQNRAKMERTGRKRSLKKKKDEKKKKSLAAKEYYYYSKGLPLRAFLLPRYDNKQDSGKKVKIAGSRQVTQMTDRLLTN